LYGWIWKQLLWIYPIERGRRAGMRARMTERFRVSEFRTAGRKVREPRIAAWRKPERKSENESENEKKRRRVEEK
jgi:hypothetical protein